MGIMKIINDAKYERREKLKKRKLFDDAELENIKAERKALETRSRLRSEKKKLSKQKFESSIIGRVISKSSKSSKIKKPKIKKTKIKKTKSKGFGNHEINEAFSIGNNKKKKRFFYE